MPIERVQISDWAQWGMLVKTWATGENCFDKPPYSGAGVPKRPQSLTEFTDQCAQFGVGITIPARVKSVQFMQSNQETLLVRLPDGGMVRDSETTIKADPGNYPLPKFYRPGYNPQFFASHPTITSDNCMIFHACRIGDYTIGQCG